MHQPYLLSLLVVMCGPVRSYWDCDIWVAVHIPYLDIAFCIFLWPLVCILIVLPALLVASVAVILTEIAAVYEDFLTFNTYGGNPLSCAVASSVLDVSCLHFAWLENEKGSRGKYYVKIKLCLCVVGKSRLAYTIFKRILMPCPGFSVIC